MMRSGSAAAAALAALAVAGCTQTASQTPGAGGALVAAVPPAEPARAVSAWQMPSQMSPAGAASATAGEEITVAFVPGTGQVRGTRATLAAISQPLPAAAGPNRTVEACRAVVEAEAVKIGAREVEAVSAGPERRNARGQFVGPVRVRITYARPDVIEVRETTMTCVVDARGRIVEARA